MSFTVAGIIRDQAAVRREKVAIVFGDRRISYRELDERSNRVARALLAAGVGPQDHVALIDMNGPEFFEVLFGCAKVNAINVGVNWRLAPGEMPARSMTRRPGSFSSAPSSRRRSARSAATCKPSGPSSTWERSTRRGWPAVMRQTRSWTRPATTSRSSSTPRGRPGCRRAP